MNKKSGTAGTAVEPIAPVAATEADTGDPGEVTATQAEGAQTTAAAPSSQTVKPFKPPTLTGASSSATQQEKDWIEIELVGEDDKPVAGEKYRVTLPDGSVDEGTLDQNGWVRVAGFDKGSCKITFPDLDKGAWEFVESGGARGPAS